MLSNGTFSRRTHVSWLSAFGLHAELTSAMQIADPIQLLQCGNALCLYYQSLQSASAAIKRCGRLQIKDVNLTETQELVLSNEPSNKSTNLANSLTLFREVRNEASSETAPPYQPQTRRRRSVTYGCSVIANAEWRLRSLPRVCGGFEDSTVAPMESP
ncbi:unnamed protein product [Sphagnum balticum]